MPLTTKLLSNNDNNMDEDNNNKNISIWNNKSNNDKQQQHPQKTHCCEVTIMRMHRAHNSLSSIQDEVQRLEDTETKLRQRFLTDTTKSEPSLSTSPASQATQASVIPQASLIIYVIVSILIGLVLAKVFL